MVEAAAEEIWNWVHGLIKYTKLVNTVLRNALLVAKPFPVLTVVVPLYHCQNVFRAANVRKFSKCVFGP